MTFSMLPLLMSPGPDGHLFDCDSNWWLGGAATGHEEPSLVVPSLASKGYEIIDFCIPC